jgi:orotate phosphoribosyltransferase
VVGREEGIEVEALGGARQGQQVVVRGALLWLGEDAQLHGGRRYRAQIIGSAALRDHVLSHSVRHGRFTLKSGRESHWFVDTKQTMCRPDGLLLVADAALPLIPDEATAIGGLTMGGDPVAFGIAAIAAARGRELRSFSVRKEVKNHGAGGRIAGALQEGDRVVITEDTVTRGTSILEAVRAVREAGADPVLALAIVDRGGTVAAMLEPEGVEFVALLTAPDLGFGYED